MQKGRVVGFRFVGREVRVSHGELRGKSFALTCNAKLSYFWIRRTLSLSPQKCIWQISETAKKRKCYNRMLLKFDRMKGEDCGKTSICICFIRGQDNFLYPFSEFKIVTCSNGGHSFFWQSEDSEFRFIFLFSPRCDPSIFHDFSLTAGQARFFTHHKIYGKPLFLLPPKFAVFFSGEKKSGKL